MKRFFTVLCILLATATALADEANLKARPAKAEQVVLEDSNAFLMHYYLHPEPQKVTPMLRSLSGVNGKWHTTAAPSLIVSFGELMRVNPELAGEWLEAADKLILQRILVGALTYANTPELLKLRDEYLAGHRLAIPPVVLNEELVLTADSPMLLDACWGGYFISGDTKYVQAIIDAALAKQEENVIDLTAAAANWSLLSIGRDHPAVKEQFCLALKNATPETRRDFASGLSEELQIEYLGEVLVQPETESAGCCVWSNVLPDDFFDFVQPEKLHFNSDLLARLQKPLESEIKKSHPELNDAQISAHAQALLWEDPIDEPVPTKRTKDGELHDFLVVIARLKNTLSQFKDAKDTGYRTGMRLAKKYPENLDVARIVFRGMDASDSIDRVTEKTLNNIKIHPWLDKMFRGERARLDSWKSRGGGYSDTVTDAGWKGFEENNDLARKYFNEAWEIAPAVETAAKMIDATGCRSLKPNEKAEWFKRALTEQADFYPAANTYTWFDRPRWCGSAEDLLANAKLFFDRRQVDPRLAMNGIYFMFAHLSEIPVIGNFRYFAVPENYVEFKETCEGVGKMHPLKESSTIFLGTVALLAGDMATADRIAEQLKSQGKYAIRRGERQGITLYCLDFSELHYAIKSLGDPGEFFDTLHHGTEAQVNAMLKKYIAAAKDERARQGFIALYATLNADVDWMSFRRCANVMVRLCYASKNNAELIDELLDMKINLEDGDFYGPLYFALKVGDRDLAKRLVDAGISPNRMCGDAPLLNCIIDYEFDLKDIQLLLELGADPNIPETSISYTPLHIAARTKNLELAKLLVKYHADVNAITTCDQSPLDKAEEYGATEVAEYLRSMGAKHCAELRKQ